MSQKDLYNNIKALIAFNAATIASNTTTNGVIIDTKGYGSVTFLIKTGAWTDGTYTPLIEEGDASNLSDKVAVSDLNLLGLESDAAVGAANTIKKIGYRVGSKRYVRLAFVSTGVTTGASLSGVVILGNADQLPQA